jgi:hypothetical protein
MRGVSFDEPLRHKLATLREEFGRRSREPIEEATRWQMPMPRMNELAPATERLLGAPRTERGTEEDR